MERARSGEPRSCWSAARPGSARRGWSGSSPGRRPGPGSGSSRRQCIELGARRPAAGPAGRCAACAGPHHPAGGAGRGARPGPAGPGPAAARAGAGRCRGTAPGEDLQAAQLLELVLGLLGRLAAAQPVMLVIEDLHWADQSTLDLVAFLVRALRELRVLLVRTYRSDELDRRHPLRPLLTGWERVRVGGSHRAAPVRPGRGRRPAGGDPRRRARARRWSTWSSTARAATPSWSRSSPAWCAMAVTRRTCRRPCAMSC